MSSFYEAHRRLILYCAIGLGGATLDFIVYWWLTSAFETDAVVATAISVSVGIVNNFIWNAVLNFRVTDRILLRFVSFYAVGLLGVLLSMAIVYALTAVAGMGPLIAKLISIPFVVIGQFVLNTYVTFASRDKLV